MNKMARGGYWEHECTRCGEVWYSKNEDPKACNGCKSPYWNKPRVR